MLHKEDILNDHFGRVSIGEAIEHARREVLGGIFQTDLKDLSSVGKVVVVKLVPVGLLLKKGKDQFLGFRPEIRAPFGEPELGFVFLKPGSDFGELSGFGKLNFRGSVFRDTGLESNQEGENTQNPDTYGFLQLGGAKMFFINKV